MPASKSKYIIKNMNKDIAVNDVIQKEISDIQVKHGYLEDLLFRLKGALMYKGGTGEIKKEVVEFLNSCLLNGIEISIRIQDDNYRPFYNKK